MKDSSPETGATPQLKESKFSEHQTRVEEIRKGLQIKKPNSPVEDIHQEARDKTAQEIIRKRLRGELKKTKDQLEVSQDQALKDPLTKMYNRRFFEEYMQRQIDLLNRNPNKRTFITLSDIDDFGLFNKNYGTNIGDTVLGEIGATYNNSVRSTDVAARWGGEEMVATFDFDTSQSGTMPLNEYLQPLNRVRNNLKDIKIMDHEGKVIPEEITSSFGVTRVIPGESFEDFFPRVSLAMKFAKLLGKDRIVSVSPTDNPNTFDLYDTRSDTNYVYTKDESGTEMLTTNEPGNTEQYVVRHNEEKKPYLAKLGSE